MTTIPRTIPPTIHEAVLDAADRRAERPALRYREGSERREIAYGRLAADVRAFAGGLVAAGVKPGDRVYLLADNSPRWIVADLGILAAGAISVPRPADTSPAENEYILRHAAVSAVVAGAPKLLPRLPADRAGPLVLLSGESEGAAPYESFLASGAGVAMPAARTEIATIVYTSGTTGTPKGVMLTHDNILHNVRTLPPLLGVGEGDLFLSVLPSWHMFERAVEYIILASGATLSYSSLRTLKTDLREERPTFLAGVPRLFEGLYTAVAGEVERKPGIGGKVARFLLARTLAFGAARRRLRGLEEDPRGAARPGRAGALPAILLNALPAVLGRKAIGGKLRAAVGGRLRAAISGGGMLPVHVDGGLDSLGVKIVVGYGLTETSPVVALRRLDRNVVGTIGRPVAETEVRIVDEAGAPLPAGESGEIFVRGPQVMRGYLKDDAATAAVLAADGWFRTGDLARLTPAGDLVFTGRRKETIVLAGGENVEPGLIETKILECPLVKQVMVVGQDRKTLAALVVPDREAAAAKGAGAGAAAIHDLVRDEIARLVCRKNGFRPRELVARIAILDREFTVEDGTMTRTLKLRRNEILARHAQTIDALYDRA